ncbi:tetratricopeptide repeat protein [Archangium sp.]|uniref:tetratricopeptide repeat protein n=1 Tax=Archangium sp. TaxID=1872627 RepID=UPI00286C968E|nr:tetratricopeptide repeat protein [Archangium sp.]
MGWGDAFRSWKLSRQVRQLVNAGEPKKALALVSSVGEQLRASTLVDLARDCDEDEAGLACELLQQALVRAPQHEDATWLLARLEAQTGRLRSSVERLRALRARFPHRLDVLAELADQLIAMGGAAEAEALLVPWEQSSETRLLCLLGKARFAQERLQEALPPLERAMELHESGQPLSDDASVELEALHTEVLAAVHGRESLVVDAARRRKLDTRAGVNFTLLAAHHMVGATCRAPSLELLPLDAMRALAEERLRGEDSEGVGLVQRGVVALREGRFREALKHFERANELSPEDFAPLLGKGAALELDQQDVLGALKHLPDVGPLEGLDRVFPDWPALTERERRVVHASVLPLRQFLPHLAERGYQVRVLPLDVRTSDVPELAHLQEESIEGDYRAFEALGGVAVGNIAVAKVEGLLSLAPGATGWVLAHEFAHLVLIAGPERLRARVQRLRRRAERIGYVGSEYQKQNEDEFFACAYTEYLARRYGLDAEQHLDDRGLAADVSALFEELETDARLE